MGRKEMTRDPVGLRSSGLSENKSSCPVEYGPQADLPKGTDTDKTSGLMSIPVLLSYADVSQQVNGRSRRTTALIRACGQDALLLQPGREHPLCSTRTLPHNLGRRKVGINWGIFNFYLRKNRQVVKNALEMVDPDILILSSIWDYRPVDHIKHLPMVLDAHNVDAVVMAQQYGAHHPFTRMVERVERKVLRAVDHIFCCSDHDHHLFQEKYAVSESRLSVVPNGVDMDEMSAPASGGIAPRLEKLLTGKTVLFFMGKLDYEPNKEALHFMSRVLMPTLEERFPGRFALLICGSPKPKKGSMHASMVFAGNVPELAPYIHRADICLAPLFKGSGTRLKILEYLGAGKPIVATPRAVEGLACAHRVHALIDEADRFPDHILQLADAPGQAHAMAINGQEFARLMYDWSSIILKWQSVLTRLRTPSIPESTDA